jgi:hypothetical protein
MSNDIDYTRLPRHELNEYLGITIWNMRSVIQRLEKKKRAAIAKMGSDVTPSYRRNRRVQKKARKAMRRHEIDCFNELSKE